MAKSVAAKDKADKAADKKKGIKQGSPEDEAADKKAGVFNFEYKGKGKSKGKTGKKLPGPTAKENY
jgi:hypothetical protein